MRAFFTFILFLFLTSTYAYRLAGGFISYKTIGNDSIEVELRLYGLYGEGQIYAYSNEFTVSNSKGVSANIANLKRHYLKKNISSRCSDSLNALSTHGVYETKYTAVINLNDSSYRFLQNSKTIHFTYYYTRRHHTILTKIPGYFFIKTTYYRSNFVQNQSIQIDQNPISLVFKNRTTRGYNQFIDMDGDLMSFELSVPHSGIQDTPFYRNYNPKQPISTFTAKNNKELINPDNNPPIGFYLNPKTGDLVFTPTEIENSLYVIEAKEYRKDSLGNSILISSTLFDMMLFVREEPNELPILNIPSQTPLCEGQPLVIQPVISEKKKLTPFGYEFPNSSYTWIFDNPSHINWKLHKIEETNSLRYTSYRFSINKDSLPKSSPTTIYFSLVQTDVCHGYNVIRKSLKITPVRKPAQSIALDSLGCGKYALSLTSDKGTKTSYSVAYAETPSLFNVQNSSTQKLNDTFSLHKAGTYLLNSTFNNMGCQYDSGFHFLLDSNVVYSLPLDTQKALCTKDSIALSVSEKWSSVVWSTGSNNSLVWVKDTGNYSVELTDSCNNTYLINYVVTQLPQTKVSDQKICIGDTLRLNAKPNQSLVVGRTFRDNLPFITRIGKYYSRIYDSTCQVTLLDSFVVSNHAPKSFILTPNPILTCDQKITTIQASKDATEEILWPDNSDGLTFITDTSGYVKLRISGVCNNFSDSILVINRSTPEITLSNDTAFCSGDSIRLMGSSRASTDSLWWTPVNSSEKTITIHNGGVYYFNAKSLCGEVRDSVQAIEFNAPDVNLGPDIAKDEFALITLRNQSPSRFATYLWSIGSNADSLQVRLAGDYWLQETNACGTDSDTINVRYTVGVEQLENTLFKVYPNPTTDYVTITAESAKEVVFAVFNAAGKQVVPPTPFVNQTVVNTQDLPAGTYTIRLTQDNKQFSSVVIVQ